jgi:tRNA1Val (adenine37-N6)-methyltransferase
MIGATLLEWPIGDDETLDNIAHGRLKVLQKSKGYRFSLDALLLAHFVCLQPGDQVLEMGAGSGVVSLILADRWDGITLMGIDIQEEAAYMAARSVAINALSHKIVIRQVDVRKIKNAFPPCSFDVAVANPPYRKINSGRINADRQKAIARHEIAGTIRDFLQAAGYVLKPSGRACFIYPATRMGELLCSLREALIEPKRLRMVHSHQNEAGQFVLLEGVKEGGEELEVMPPLFIYEKKGEYTAEMAGIFKELSSSPGISAR